MTPELQQYYEERLSMMGSQGWKDLVEDVQKMYDATNRLDGVSLDDVKYRQGELSMMRWILSLREVSETTYEDLQRESK